MKKVFKKIITFEELDGHSSFLFSLLEKEFSNFGKNVEYILIALEFNEFKNCPLTVEQINEIRKYKVFVHQEPNESDNRFCGVDKSCFIKSDEEYNKIMKLHF